MIDQTRLPQEMVIHECRDYREVAEAIRTMKVRGAPAIGVTAAFGLALAAWNSDAKTARGLKHDLAEAAEVLRSTRPTAVNLSWALNRMGQRAERLENWPVAAIKESLLAEAQCIAQEDEEANRKMGYWGAQLIKDRDVILTHCNTGSLATAGYGTALGVIRTAHSQGKRIRVLVDETRPLLQGARLTAWELLHDGIPATLIADSMAGHFIKSIVNVVIVGADRIAANGDVANKIGTYGLAVLARENGIPFYVVAPTSTIDLSVPSGDAIPIEMRRPEEVLSFAGVRIAPEGVQAANPAFDITPHRYVGAIITEKGIHRPPYEKSLAEAVGTPSTFEREQASGEGESR